ncbi:MAG: hypothetical protein IPL08_10500 [Saprospiraceae bacterium]|nr:hypothetical protein [Saprospiraceae bacterium]
MYKHMLTNVTDEKVRPSITHRSSSYMIRRLLAICQKALRQKMVLKRLNTKLGYCTVGAYDMFYTINSSYDDNVVALDNCIKYAGRQC